MNAAKAKVRQLKDDLEKAIEWGNKQLVPTIKNKLVVAEEKVAKMLRAGKARVMK